MKDFCGTKLDSSKHQDSIETFLETYLENIISKLSVEPFWIVGPKRTLSKMKTLEDCMYVFSSFRNGYQLVQISHD